MSPSNIPTVSPSEVPSMAPTELPSTEPTNIPSLSPFSTPATSETATISKTSTTTSSHRIDIEDIDDLQCDYDCKSLDETSESTLEIEVEYSFAANTGHSIEGMDCFIFHIISRHFIMTQLDTEKFEVCDITTVRITGGWTTSCVSPPCLVSNGSTLNHDGNVSMTLISTESQITELAKPDLVDLTDAMEFAFSEIWHVNVDIVIALRIVETADISSVQTVVVGEGDTHFHLQIIWIIMLSVAICFCLIGTTLMLCVLPSIRRQPDGADTKKECTPHSNGHLVGNGHHGAGNSRFGFDSHHGTNSKTVCDHSTDTQMTQSLKQSVPLNTMSVQTRSRRSTMSTVPSMDSVSIMSTGLSSRKRSSHSSALPMDVNGNEDLVPLQMQVEDVYQRQLEAVRLSQATNGVSGRHDDNEELQEGLKPMPLNMLTPPVARRMGVFDDALAMSLPRSPMNEGMGQLEGVMDGDWEMLHNDKMKRKRRRRKMKKGKYHHPQIGFIDTGTAVVSL